MNIIIGIFQPKSMINQFVNKKRFFTLAIFSLIFVLFQTSWRLQHLKYKNTNVSYVTLCNARLQGNHRIGNHLFMLSALLDFAIKTQREIILPAKGWVLDKIFDFNQLKYPFGGHVFKITRYESKSSICPCKIIQSPHHDYDVRFNQSQFLKIYSDQNVSSSKVNVEMCGLSQTYLHTLTPEVSERLSLLPKLLKGGAFDKARVIIQLFKKIMLKDELSSFALYSYNGIEDNSTSYISLKSYSDDESTFPSWFRFLGSVEEEPFVVGVHLRMGDFLHPSSVKYGLTVADGNYFLHSFQYFIKAHRKIVFVVLSDDMNWAREHFPNYFHTTNSSSTFNTTDIKIVFFRDSLPQDFAFLCRSDGLIMSTGTFGWWAGWFNSRATVIYYDNYPRSNSALGKLLDKKKYYIKRWIPML